ncbi:senescence-associated carboxylesterase 101-like [Abrus precatorius]|uniref:Senescence-associated carboxylesterase 101-like n=1 Tax=Abrus precatorius TaxID=3816 RepID=A0A8B8LSH1_ABRPR|nr:senescence-associated carboxylesterase 101-like [Abrus precatorius]
MAQSALFSSGMELAPLVISTGLLRRSWDAISSRYEGIVSNKGEGLSWKVYKDFDSDFMIIVFEATSDSFNIQADLTPSSAVREEDFLHFDFLCSKANPVFSINSTAFSLFYRNHQRLDEWKKSDFEMNSATPLIVTGHGLGGSIACLFTISLFYGMRSVKNRPLCITYGSPLIGDKQLQQAISRSPIWNSCFLHVVSIKDPLPRLFIRNHSSSAAALSPKTSTYMPFGTYLLCSDVNSTCFDNPDSILEFLIALGSIYGQNQGFDFTAYENIVENLTHKAICKDLTTVDENEPLPKSDSVLASSISLQLRALGLTPHMQKLQKDIDINNLGINMKRLEEKSIIQRRVKFNPSKKLSQMKTIMAQLEWYKKEAKSRGIGYYDSYKNMKSLVDEDVVVFHKQLRIYWEKMVEEANIKPQKGGAAFRKSWLYAGTSYRRMVEPLTIADYYKQGGKDYMTDRPKHFVLLEEWFRNETTKDKTSNVEAISRIQDSQFWACVEKALLSRQHSVVYVEDNWDLMRSMKNLFQQCVLPFGHVLTTFFFQAKS